MAEIILSRTTEQIIHWACLYKNSRDYKIYEQAKTMLRTHHVSTEEYEYATKKITEALKI